MVLPEKTKAMTSDGNLESVSTFKIYDSRKGNRPRIRFWNWKVKLLVGFFIILVLVFLAALIVLEFLKSTKNLRSAKTKRSVKMAEYYEKPEMGQDDVHIIPEGQLQNFERRANHHPNHRYIEIEPDVNIYKKIMKDLYDESGWSPKPFDVKTDEYLGSVRSIMSKQKREGKNGKRKFPNAPAKGLRGPLRFEGFYGYASPEGQVANNPGPENFYYSKEINNLMQNYSANEGVENTTVKKTFKSHGVPFQVAVKDVPEREKLNLYQTSFSKPKQSRFKERFKRRPLTILLDIYPMAETDYFNAEGDEFNRVIKPPRNKFSKQGEIPSKGKFPFPRERRNGIIMKLNLYAKEKRVLRRENSNREAEEAIHLRDNKRAEKKTFKWFPTKEEKKGKPKECSLAALGPNGKHVTAKWKNGNGEWIHAKRLSVKYLKEKE